MDIDFVEIATSCQNRYKESINGENSVYCKTLFVAIDSNNDVYSSDTPHILKSANKCILIHERSTRAIRNWYNWYMVEFVNEYGEVHESLIDDEFELTIRSIGKFDNQIMQLAADRYIYYTCRSPWEHNIKKVWQLYCRLKETKSVSERKLISSLFLKDESILELEKSNKDFSFIIHSLEEEKKTYISLINELKQIIRSKE